MYSYGLPDEIVTKLRPIVCERRNEWIIALHFSNRSAELEWLSDAVSDVGLQPDLAIVDGLRIEFLRQERVLSPADREQLKALSSDPRVLEVRKHLLYAEDYAELDEILAQEFNNPPLTATRLRYLSMQLTNYMFGHGDLRTPERPTEETK